MGLHGAGSEFNPTSSVQPQLLLPFSHTYSVNQAKEIYF